jgi:hypothetical protein
MELQPRLRREVSVGADTATVSTWLANEMPKAGMHVQQFLPGLRILASAFRLASFTLGQEIRIDFRAVGPAETIAFVESRFHFPGVDFTHENDKNVTLIESLLLSYTPAA